jgi:prophage antirepressor-like protein
MQQILNSFQFGVNPIRVAIRDGEPWFAAADVCPVLDLGNVSQSLSRLDPDEKVVISNDTPGGVQGLLHINESGLYTLVLGSRKPEAKAFKKWITSEVIPAIRKTGSYGVPQSDPMAVLNDPAAMRGLLLGYTEKVLTLEGRVTEQAGTIATLEPKALGLDRIATQAQGAYTITESAKVLQVAPRKFFAFLQANEWIYRQNGRWNAYQDKVVRGLMEHKFCNIHHAETVEFDVAQPMVTPRGIAKLAQMLGVPEVR